MDIGLVGCGKIKNDHECKAKEMYLGTLFRYASAYCERYDCWYILSAKYGLLDPETIIAPYDETLVGKTKKEKIRWRVRVLMQMSRCGILNERFFLHAGKNYLLPDINITTPMKGLGIGRQLAWYKRHSSMQC